jgi:hypothetical protein
MSTTRDWPGSGVQQQMLIDAVGKFLRTHQEGGQRLMDLMASIPPDRTEEEYRELRERAAAEHEAAIQANLKAYNQRRWVQGEPPIDRQGTAISTDPIKSDAPEPSDG